jgi:hypothetical protein
MSNQEISLYHSSDITLEFFKSDIRKYNVSQLQEFIDCTSSIKIAYVNLIIFPYMKEELDLLVKSQLLIIKITELHDSSAHAINCNNMTDLLKRYDAPNVVFLVNGNIHAYTTKYATIRSDLSWFYSTAYPYLEKLKLLIEQKLNPYSIKEFSFDILYGQKREHRVFVKKLLEDYRDSNYFLESNFFDDHQYVSQSQINDSIFWEDEIELLNDNIDQENQRDKKYYLDKYFSCQKCYYYGQQMNISQVIPFKIFTRSAYSLICETDFSNNFSFYSEKIVKPIIAKRLFIVVSGQYYLKGLREQGFKTFEGIIDESYDNEPNNELRWKMAVDQAVALAQQDQHTILEKIRTVVEHNFLTLTKLKTTAVSDEITEYLQNK